jgi:hypothetical protein
MDPHPGGQPHPNSSTSGKHEVVIAALHQQSVRAQDDFRRVLDVGRKGQFTATTASDSNVSDTTSSESCECHANVLGL